MDSPTYKNKIIYSIEEAAPFFYGEECLDADGKVKDKYLQRLRHACKLHREGKVGTKIYIPKKAIDTLGEKFTQHNINLS